MERSISGRSTFLTRTSDVKRKRNPFCITKNIVPRRTGEQTEHADEPLADKCCSRGHIFEPCHVHVRGNRADTRNEDAGYGIQASSCA